MKKVLFIVVFFISILNSDTLKKSINKTDMIKNKIYLIKNGDRVKALTKDTILNIFKYKDKRVVTLLSGSAKLIIK